MFENGLDVNAFSIGNVIRFAWMMHQNRLIMNVAMVMLHLKLFLDNTIFGMHNDDNKIKITIITSFPKCLLTVMSLCTSSTQSTQTHSSKIKITFIYVEIYLYREGIKLTYVSAKLLKMLLAATPFVFDKMLLEREPSVIEMGDVANEIGPPTSIGGESAFGGLFPEFCDVLNKSDFIRFH